jgi:hypothetical protein
MGSDFDYSRLDGVFGKLSKPAKRALMNEGIYTPEDLAKLTLKEIKTLHGIGPSALPVLIEALAAKGLAFKD